MYRLLWLSLALAADPQEFATGRCEGDGTGADSYFSGMLSVTNGEVVGVERWHLFPNKSWAARGAGPCTLAWTVTGKVGAVGKCADCDLSVTFRAVPGEASDTCPAELLQGRLTRTGQRVGSEFGVFEGHYDIRRGADGAAAVFFAKSGKALGTGKVEGETIHWQSNHQCKWF
jgi:hypothetical protein